MIVTGRFARLHELNRSDRAAGQRHSYHAPPDANLEGNIPSVHP